MDTVNIENFTISETVQVFRIGRTRLYSLIANGDVDAFKLGRRTLVRAASVRTFMSELPAVRNGR